MPPIMKINYKLAQTEARSLRQKTNMRNCSTGPTSLYKKFNFPQNIYAHVQELQEGETNYLHYGLFQQKDNDLNTAQQYSTELLMAQLPPPPCRILDVGVGLGTTLTQLIQRGYQVHGITPHKHEAAYIYKKLGEQTAITCQRLEDFEAMTNRFDVILFQESAQYIEPLVIFNKALDLLDVSGHLLIMDTFALKHVETETEAFPLLADLVSLADRLGFELVKQLDLTAMATPMFDYWLQATKTHRQRLLKELKLSEQTLTQLDASNQSYQNKFIDGYYSYAQLHFRKKLLPKWRLKILEKKHMPEMLNLFKKTFLHSMTPETWQWKYGKALEREIGIWRENQLIAHYGGISRKILFFAQPQIAVQIGDVMVDTADRGILTKKGPFFLMAATFLERYIGYGKPYLLGFGFPNERHMKIAERLGLYVEVEKMTEISWGPLPRRPRWRTRLRSINGIEDKWATIAINKCWQRMARKLHDAIVGVRDCHYLQHRYLNHPSQRYQIVLVSNRFGSKTHGVLVLRHDTNGCEIVDIVAPLDKIPLLITHARRLAGIRGHNHVFCRITENFATHFKTKDSIFKELDIRIPTNVWSNGPSPETIKNHWWLMSGDTDSR